MGHLKNWPWGENKGTSAFFGRFWQANQSVTDNVIAANFVWKKKLKIVSTLAEIFSFLD